MDNMATIEIKAFVPARDFALSKRFYQDIGFTLAWSMVTWRTFVTRRIRPKGVSPD